MWLKYITEPSGDPENVIFNSYGRIKLSGPTEREEAGTDIFEVT